MRGRIKNKNGLVQVGVKVILIDQRYILFNYSLLGIVEINL